MEQQQQQQDGKRGIAQKILEPVDDKISEPAY
jgi:hypothetical protein